MTQPPSSKKQHMLRFKCDFFYSNVNYHFKSLQLKKALIRLALPLNSHSLRGTSTDLCVSIQQRVVHVFVCVCTHFKIVFVRVWACSFVQRVSCVCMFLCPYMNWVIARRGGHACATSFPSSQNADMLWLQTLLCTLCLYHGRFVPLKNLEHPLKTLCPPHLCPDTLLS